MNYNLMKIIQATSEKDPDTGRNKILVEINQDDGLMLEQALSAFDKYDKDDFKYRAKLEDLKEQVHKTWTLLWPS